MLHKVGFDIQDKYIEHNFIIVCHGDYSQVIWSYLLKQYGEPAIVSNYEDFHVKKIIATTGYSRDVGSKETEKYCIEKGVF